MGIFGLVSGLFGMIGSGIGSLFSFKGKQAEVMEKAIEVLGDANASNAQREQAIAQIIAAENSSGNWLSASWRPITMMVFLVMLVSYWFGYVPPNLLGPLPPAVAELFGIIKIGLGGYIGGRSLEKIVNSMNIGKVLQKFIEKKIL